MGFVKEWFAPKQPAYTPPPQTSRAAAVPTKDDEPVQDARRKAMTDASNKGRASTLATGVAGDISDPNLARKLLLGA